MKQISESFDAHLRGETTTLCFCWKLQRRDGVIMGFTDHDRDLTFDGITYECRSGFEGGEVEEFEGLAPDTAGIAGGLSSDAITESDIRSGRYDGASVELWLVNWKNLQERLLQGAFHLGELTTSGAIFKAELKSPAARLDETVGRSFTRRCDAEFGDTRCRINLNTSNFSVSATVNRQLGDSQFEITGIDEIAPQWFANGRLEWVDGPLAGETAVIAEHAASSAAKSIVLWEPVHGEIEPGTRVRLIAGCDKTFATCKARFSNSINFQGFPHIPGNDFTFNYAANSKRHDGSPIVP